MSIILIEYIAFVNLLGFLLMWFDKGAARRHGRRIPERVLFCIAVIGGSIGTLIAMYLLRHKTRHLSFTVGIPLILLVQLLLAGMLSFRKHEELQSPSTTVKNELSLIRELDDDAISGILSYDHFMPGTDAAPAAGADAAEAIRAFFRSFTFQIRSEKTEGSHAEVVVDITNIDTHALARDLRIDLTRTSLSLDPGVSVPSALDNYYTLLKQTLESNEYETAVTEAVFHLTRDGKKDWSIDSDETLEDALVSHFITYLNDPYLLSAQEVLEIWLGQFRSLTPEEWIRWLSVSDLFSTGSETYGTRIDQAFFDRLCRAFSCSVVSCSEERDRAEADVSITSIDLTETLRAYRSSLLAYADDPENITKGDAQLADDSARFLLDALSADGGTKETPARIRLRNDGHSWKPELSEDFIDAMCGGLAESLEDFADAAESE